MQWWGLIVVCVSGCGRLGFDARGTDDAPTDGQASDALGSTLVSATSTCQPSPLALTLDRPAAANDTLLVALYTREPEPPDPPTISGGTLPWVTDASVSSASSLNRRHLSLFRANLATTVPAGEQIQIAFPNVESVGAALFIIPGVVSTPGTELAVMYEGEASPFAGTSATAATHMMCALVHHNEATGVEFAPEWRVFYDLTSNCGGTRQSAGMHLRFAPGGQTDCAGMISNPAFAWITVQVGYSGIAVQ